MELDHLYDIGNYFILNANIKIEKDSEMLFLKLKR